MRHQLTTTVTLLLAVILASCQGVNQTPTLPANGAPINVSDNSIGPTRSTAGPTLYVLNTGGGHDFTATVYSKGGASFVRTIPVGTLNRGFAVDALGHLYIGSWSGPPKDPAVLDVYKSRGAKVIRTLSQTHAFGQLTFDNNGNLYTLCAIARICEYPGAKEPVSRTISLHKFGAGGSSAMATDSAGDLAVDGGEVVLVFPPGATAPNWKISSGIASSTALKFDSSGNLYVVTDADCCETFYVAVYPSGATSPARTITDGIGRPVALLFDASGNLYVCNAAASGSGGSVAIYPPGASTPSRTITNGLDNPIALSIDSQSNLYVANQGSSEGDSGSVTVYNPGATKPKRTVTEGIIDPVAVGTNP
jgi:hypothetical protein